MVSPHTDLQRFGSEVRKARTAKGWTLTQLAHEAFGNQDRKGFVSQIENGKRKLSALTIQKLHSVLSLPQTVVDGMLGLPLPQEDDRSPQEDEAEALITAQGPAAERLKLSEALVIALAYKYAEGNPADFDGALAGLERALEVAAEARERLPGNVSDAVAEVERRVAELNDTGEVDAAEDALWEELERAEAAQMRLVDRGLEQVVLTRNVDRAVALEVKKWGLEQGGFDDLRAVQDLWYERGRDKGLRFDLEVAIGLARACCDGVASPDARGAALNDLGTALWTLGAREGGAARLEEAVAAYRAALEEYTRDRVPLDWAATQNNLGNALWTLGDRESGTARLEEAVTAFRAALEECTRDRVPLDWAMTQNNLGNALQTLGDRESGTARLEEAVAAFRAALEERTRDRVPLNWAMTQNNLGNALWTLGERQSDTARLQEAVTAFRAALEEHTQDRVPLDWAMTQNNLAAALRALGARESGTARLEDAVTAYRAALEEWTRDRVPLDWAMTQGNLGILELAYFDKTGEAARLDAAERYAALAREVYVEGGADHYVDGIDGLIAGIAKRRAG